MTRHIIKNTFSPDEIEILYRLEIGRNGELRLIGEGRNMLGYVILNITKEGTLVRRSVSGLAGLKLDNYGKIQLDK